MYNDYIKDSIYDVVRDKRITTSEKIKRIEDIVNSSSSSQSSKSSDQDQDSQQYIIGKRFGMLYAQQLYNNKGGVPVMADFYELPDLPDMKILKFINESASIDVAIISNILDSYFYTDEEKTNRIYDLIFNSNNQQGDQGNGSQQGDQGNGGQQGDQGNGSQQGDQGNGSQQGDQGNGSQQGDQGKNSRSGNSNSTNSNSSSGINKGNILDAGDYVVMVNKSYDENSPMSGNHVISKDKGEQLRKDNNVVELSSSITLQEKIDAIAKIYAPNAKDKIYGVDTSAMIETGVKMQNRVIASRDGIINWASALKKNVSKLSTDRELTDTYNKNIYVQQDIVLWDEKRKKEKFNRCVVYIDTSGSVNNNDTQLIPIMAGEVGKIAYNCKFRTIDINLFNDYVYSDKKYKNLNTSVVKRPGFTIEGVSDGGGTNVQNVYKHIYDNYTRNGNILKGVDSIIIITDYSGMVYSGDINECNYRLRENVQDRMVYVIYTDVHNINADEIRKQIKSLVPKKSKHFEIPLDVFRNQLERAKQSRKKTNENINNRFMRRIMLNEVARGRKGRDTGTETTQAEKEKTVYTKSGNFDDVGKIKLSDDEIRRINAKNEFSVIRRRGKLAEFDATKDIIKSLNDFDSSLKSSDELTYVMNTYGTYYVDMNSYGFIVILHVDVNNNNWDKFMELCKSINLVTLVGNVVLHDELFKKINFDNGNLPKGFPKNIYGDFDLVNLENLTTPGNFENFPTVINGKNIRIVNIGSNSDEIKEKLKTYMEKNGFYGRSFNGRPKARNIVDEINDRISLGESYINEALGQYGNPLRDLFKSNKSPQKSKYGSDAEWDDAIYDYYNSDLRELEENNRLFFNLLFNADNSIRSREYAEKSLNAINGEIDRLEKKPNKSENAENELEALKRRRDRIEKKVNTLSDIDKSQATPLVDIEWNNIPAKNVIVEDSLALIRHDVKNVSDRTTTQAGKGYSKNIGLKIFTNSNNRIGAVYGTLSKTLSNEGKTKYSKPQVIALSGDYGRPVTDQIEIKKIIKRRYDKIYNEVKGTLYTELGINKNSVTSSYRFSQNDIPHKATLKSFALNILYNVISKKLKCSDAIGNTCDIEKVIVDKYRDVDAILTYIFGFIYNRNRWDKDKRKVFLGRGNKGVNFDNIKRNNQGFKRNWYNYCYNKSELNNKTVFELFSNEFIKALLIGSSIRDEIGQYPIYGFDDIMGAYRNGDRNALLEMIRNVEDVEIVSTTLKSLSIIDNNLNDTREEDITEDTPIPFNVMLLFPDKCSKEYKINIDVQDARELRHAKSRVRTLSRGKNKYSNISLSSNDPSQSLKHLYDEIYKYTDPENSDNLINNIIERINDLNSYDQTKLETIAKSLTDGEKWSETDVLNVITDALLRKLGIAKYVTQSVSGNTGDKNFDYFVSKHSKELERVYNNGLKLIDQMANIQLDKSDSVVVDSIDKINVIVNELINLACIIFRVDRSTIISNADKDMRKKNRQMKKNNSSTMRSNFAV